MIGQGPLQTDRQLHLLVYPLPHSHVHHCSSFHASYSFHPPCNHHRRHHPSSSRLSFSSCLSSLLLLPSHPPHPHQPIWHSLLMCSSNFYATFSPTKPCSLFYFLFISSLGPDGSL